MSKKFEPSLSDEIDFKVIDQLHTATLNFSNMSLEIKKIYFVLIGIAVPSLIKLANDKLDKSLFITVYVLTVTFFLLDSFTYFYQDKLRGKMNDLFNQIKTRNLEKTDSAKEGITIETNRTSVNRLLRSFLNWGNLLYAFLILINSIGLLLLSMNII